MTLVSIGAQIRRAIDEAEPPHNNPTLIAGLVGLESDDTLTAWMEGKGKRGPGAVAIWKISFLTGKPFSFFAGVEESLPAEGFAGAADQASLTVSEMRAMLARFEDELSGLRRLALAAAGSDNVKATLAAGTVEKRSQKPGKAVTVPRKTTG